MAKKPTIKTIQSGYTSVPTLNENFEALQNAFNNTLSLDGSLPNSMRADLDMNNNALLNVQDIIVDGRSVFNLLDNVTVSTSSPSGGDDGDIWFKVNL